MSTGAEARAARALLGADAVRDACHRLLALGLAGRLAHFRVDATRVDLVAHVVAGLTRSRFPDLQVPLHSRWRHFVLGGRDRFAPIAARMAEADRVERARRAVDLVVVSVLLDAGAGPRWRYRDAASGMVFARSEGLALASLDLFAAGTLSDREGDPLRVDAAALERLDAATLAGAFQVDAENPLVGLEGRAALLRRLGAVLREQARRAGSDAARPGMLVDRIAAGGREVRADAILAAVLDALGPIWPGRTRLGGVDLGDTWYHAALAGPRPGDGLCPLHKLSQWLAWSLVEPLTAAGIAVRDLDRLTGLAEYRNGGLLLDLGVLVPRDPALTAAELTVDAEPVVEWRALTVALLDRVAERVRAVLGVDARRLPLGAVLEGGTWLAGREQAARRRGGEPPVRITSDGTVF